MRRNDGAGSGPRVWRMGRLALLGVGAAATLGLAGCGGRVADPVALSSDLDTRLNCAHLGAEKAANLRRMEDLREERVENRIRSVARLPGAIIGNPLSALVMADPSIAIYEELEALEKRNARIDEIKAQKNCGVAPTDLDSAVAAPLDPIDPSLYEAAADPGEPTAQALAAPQPEVDPQILRGEEAEVVAEPVALAVERDRAAAERAEIEAAYDAAAEPAATEPTAGEPTAAAPAAAE